MIYHRNKVVPCNYSVSYKDTFGDTVTRMAVVDEFGNLVILTTEQALQAWRLTRA